MFIDIHAHAYRYKQASWNFCRPEQLLEDYDKLKIDMGVLLPIVSPEIYLPQAVEDIIEMSEKYPDRFIPYCNLDPRAVTNTPKAPLAEVLQYWKDLGCKGVGEVMPTMHLLDPMVQNLFAAANAVDLPIVYDGSAQPYGDFGLYDDPGLPQLEFTLQQFPKLKIFGHGPVFWCEIARLSTIGERTVFMDADGRQYAAYLPKGPIEEEGAVPRLMRKYPNLHGDLSDPTAFNAIARDEKYGPRFLTEFQDRLYFGTDICYHGMAVPLCDLLISWKETGKISETVFRKIAWENAAKLFGL